MRRLGILVASVLVAAVFGAAVLAAGVAGTALPGESAPGGRPSLRAVTSIPPMFLDLYQRAALTCRGLPWTILAGIGTVESDNGRSRAPGVTSGTNFAGAEGPMQFLASTFSSVAVVGPGGADIYQVKFEKGSLDYRIWLSRDGKVDSAAIRSSE